MIMAALFLIAIFVFTMDIIVDRFRDYIDVVAVVLETSGVRVGSPVLIEGMEAGRVTGIDVMELGGRGAIALHVRLEDRARSVVRVGSRAYTARRNLIGEPGVRISAAPPGSPPLESGDTIRPADRPSLEVLMRGGKDFIPALDSLNIALVELERLVDTRRPDMRAVVDHLALAADEAATLRRDLDGGTIGHWLRDPALGQRIDQLRLRVAALSEAAAGLQRYGDPEMREGMAALGQRAEEVGFTLDELERRLGQGDGFLTRMGRDSALAVALSGVQAQIDSLSAAGIGFALRMFLP